MREILILFVSSEFVAAHIIQRTLVWKEYNSPSIKWVCSSISGGC